MSARLPAAVVVDPDDADVSDPWSSLGVERTANTLTYISDVQSAVAQIEKRLEKSHDSLVTHSAASIPVPSASTSTLAAVFASTSALANDSPSTSATSLVSKNVLKFETEGLLAARMPDPNTSPIPPPPPPQLHHLHYTSDPHCPVPHQNTNNLASGPSSDPLTLPKTFDQSQPNPQDPSDHTANNNSGNEMSATPYPSLHSTPAAAIPTESEAAAEPITGNAQRLDTSAELAPALSAITIVKEINVDAASVAAAVEKYENPSTPTVGKEQSVHFESAPIAPVVQHFEHPIALTAPKTVQVATDIPPIAPTVEQFEAPVEMEAPRTATVDSVLAPIAPIVESFEDLDANDTRDSSDADNVNIKPTPISVSGYVEEVETPIGITISSEQPLNPPSTPLTQTITHLETNHQLGMTDANPIQPSPSPPSHGLGQVEAFDTESGHEDADILPQVNVLLLENSQGAPDKATGDEVVPENTERPASADGSDIAAEDDCTTLVYPEAEVERRPAVEEEKNATVDWLKAIGDTSSNELIAEQMKETPTVVGPIGAGEDGPTVFCADTEAERQTAVPGEKPDVDSQEDTREASSGEAVAEQIDAFVSTEEQDIPGEEGSTTLIDPKVEAGRLLVTPDEESPIADEEKDTAEASSNVNVEEYSEALTTDGPNAAVVDDFVTFVYREGEVGSCPVIPEEDKFIADGEEVTVETARDMTVVESIQAPSTDGPKYSTGDESYSLAFPPGDVGMHLTVPHKENPAANQQGATGVANDDGAVADIVKVSVPTDGLHGQAGVEGHTAVAEEENATAYFQVSSKEPTGGEHIGEAHVPVGGTEIGGEDEPTTLKHLQIEDGEHIISLEEANTITDANEPTILEHPQTEDGEHITALEEASATTDANANELSTLEHPQTEDGQHITALEEANATTDANEPTILEHPQTEGSELTTALEEANATVDENESTTFEHPQTEDSEHTIALEEANATTDENESSTLEHPQTEDGEHITGLEEADANEPTIIKHPQTEDGEHITALEEANATTDANEPTILEHPQTEDGEHQIVLEEANPTVDSMDAVAKIFQSPEREELPDAFDTGLSLRVLEEEQSIQGLATSATLEDSSELSQTVADEIHLAVPEKAAPFAFSKDAVAETDALPKAEEVAVAAAVFTSLLDSEREQLAQEVVMPVPLQESHGLSQAGTDKRHPMVPVKEKTSAISEDVVTETPVSPEAERLQVTGLVETSLPKLEEGHLAQNVLSSRSLQESNELSQTTTDKMLPSARETENPSATSKDTTAGISSPEEKEPGAAVLARHSLPKEEEGQSELDFAISAPFLESSGHLDETTDERHFTHPVKANLSAVSRDSVAGTVAPFEENEVRAVAEGGLSLTETEMEEPAQDVAMSELVERPNELSQATAIDPAVSEEECASVVSMEAVVEVVPPPEAEELPTATVVGPSVTQPEEEQSAQHIAISDLLEADEFTKARAHIEPTDSARADVILAVHADHAPLDEASSLGPADDLCNVVDQIFEPIQVLSQRAESPTALDRNSDGANEFSADTPQTPLGDDCTVPAQVSILPGSDEREMHELSASTDVSVLMQNSAAVPTVEPSIPAERESCSEKNILPLSSSNAEDRASGSADAEAVEQVECEQNISACSTEQIQELNSIGEGSEGACDDPSTSSHQTVKEPPFQESHVETQKGDALRDLVDVQGDSEPGSSTVETQEVEVAGPGEEPRRNDCDSSLPTESFDKSPWSKASLKSLSENETSRQAHDGSQGVCVSENVASIGAAGQDVEALTREELSYVAMHFESDDVDVPVIDHTLEKAFALVAELETSNSARQNEKVDSTAAWKTNTESRSMHSGQNSIQSSMKEDQKSKIEAVVVTQTALNGLSGVKSKEAVQATPELALPRPSLAEGIQLGDTGTNQVPQNKPERASLPEPIENTSAKASAKVAEEAEEAEEVMLHDLEAVETTGPCTGATFVVQAKDGNQSVRYVPAMEPTPASETVRENIFIKSAGGVETAAGLSRAIASAEARAQVTSETGEKSVPRSIAPSRQRVNAAKSDISNCEIKIDSSIPEAILPSTIHAGSSGSGMAQERNELGQAASNRENPAEMQSPAEIQNEDKTPKANNSAAVTQSVASTAKHAATRSTEIVADVHRMEVVHSSQEDTHSDEQYANCAEASSDQEVEHSETKKLHHSPTTPNTRTTAPGSPMTPDLDPPQRADLSADPDVSPSASPSNERLSRPSPKYLVSGRVSNDMKPYVRVVPTSTPSTYSHQEPSLVASSSVSRRSTLSPKLLSSLQNKVETSSRRLSIRGSLSQHPSTPTRPGRSMASSRDPSPRSASRNATGRTTFSKLPRVAGLSSASSSSEKSSPTQPRLPRVATFSGSLPKAKTPFSATAPQRRPHGAPSSPSSPRGPISANLPSDRATPALGAEARVRAPVLRRALSFTGIRRSSGSTPASSPRQLSPPPHSPSASSPGGRRQVREVQGSPGAQRLDRRVSLSVSDASRSRPPLMRPPRNKPTVPQPFDLTGVQLHEKSLKQIEQARKRAHDMERRRRTFKARPMPDFSNPQPKPFV